MATRRVSFHDVPPDVDADWWRRHRHLFSWNERAGGLEFEPGPAPTGEVGEPPESELAPSEGVTPPGPKLAELVGQERVRQNLHVAVAAARASEETLGHVLLAGPPGLGKTSLARAVATEVGGELQSVLAPVIRDPEVLIRHLTSLRSGSVLFLDEVHRLPARAAEVLYDAMEGGVLDLPVRCGWEQRALRVRVAPFTLVAATTEEDRLPEPLRSRFVHRERLAFYSRGELSEILGRAAREREVALTPEALELLAGASRDAPREGLALLQAVRDEATAAGQPFVDTGVVEAALARTGTTPQGVTEAETEYLRVLARAGRPLALSTLAAKLGTTRRTVQRVYEPFLMRRGLVRTTGLGRCLADGSVVATPQRLD